MVGQLRFKEEQNIRRNKGKGTEMKNWKLTLRGKTFILCLDYVFENLSPFIYKVLFK